jgi:hypothetical protein
MTAEEKKVYENCSWTDLMLKPWVGVMWVASSEARVFKMVVLPALS